MSAAKSAPKISVDFELDNPAAQGLAIVELGKLGLDYESRTVLESNWRVQWSQTWGKGKSKFKRTLYQWYGLNAQLVSFLTLLQCLWNTYQVDLWLG